MIIAEAEVTTGHIMGELSGWFANQQRKKDVLIPRLKMTHLPEIAEAKSKSLLENILCFLLMYFQKT